MSGQEQGEELLELVHKKRRSASSGSSRVTTTTTGRRDSQAAFEDEDERSTASRLQSTEYDGNILAAVTNEKRSTGADAGNDGTSELHRLGAVRVYGIGSGGRLRDEESDIESAREGSFDSRGPDPVVGRPEHPEPPLLEAQVVDENERTLMQEEIRRQLEHDAPCAELVDLDEGSSRSKTFGSIRREWCNKVILGALGIATITTLVLVLVLVVFNKDDDPLTPSTTPTFSPQYPNDTSISIPQPTPEQTPEPTPQPTPEQTPEPTPQPTPEQTPEPTPRWIQLTALQGELGYDQVGTAVAISRDGSTMALGAPQSCYATCVAPGFVKVYRIPSFTQLGQTLTGDDGEDDFGASLALSSDGRTLAVGATQEYNVGRGFVRLFQWSQDSWNQLGQDILGESLGDNSGSSVSLSGDGRTVAVAATNNDENGESSGHVRIYKFEDSFGWQQHGQDIDGESKEVGLGSSVAVSSDGSTIAVGASRSFVGLPGYARVYQYNGTTWAQLGEDITGGTKNTDRFGASVALSSNGTVLAAGAPDAGDSGVFKYWAGHVYVYQYNGNKWVQLGQIIEGEKEDDFLGGSLSLSEDGSIVAAGAAQTLMDDGYPGYVQVFQYHGNQWKQQGQTVRGTGTDDWLGDAVSLSGDGKVLCIGAPQVDAERRAVGEVRVYELFEG